MMENEVKEFISEKKIKIETKKKYFPLEEEIYKHLKKDETFCKKEEKFVYNPKKRKHCPYCGGKF